MSTWTDEKHKAAREAAEGFIAHGGHRIRNITLSDALDEIERLRALTTITDDMVERVAAALWENYPGELSWEWALANDADQVRFFRSDARVALEAALNPPA